MGPQRGLVLAVLVVPGVPVTSVVGLVRRGVVVVGRVAHGGILDPGVAGIRAVQGRRGVRAAVVGLDAVGTLGP